MFRKVDPLIERGESGALAPRRGVHVKMIKDDRVQASEPDLLFAYGTLRRECRNHKVLRRLRGRFLAEGHIRGTLYDLEEFP